MSIYYGYARVSTQEQSDNSIQNQLEYLRLKALDLEMSYVPLHEKQSGSSLEGRPVMRKILKEAKQGDCVGFYDNSRLGRNTNESLEIVDILIKKGVRVQIGGKIIDDSSPRDELLFTIEAAIATFYRKEQNLKSRIGMDATKRSGKWIFGGRMLGYDVIKVNGEPQVRINEEEAKIVTYIFERYASGTSINKITKELNEKGHRTKTGYEFNSASVRRLIHKPIYMGFYKFDGGGPHIGQDTVPLKTADLIRSQLYQPIVSEELWYQVQNSYRNLRRKHSVQFPYRYAQYELSSMIACYYCKKIDHATNYVHSFHKSPCTKKVNSNYINRVHLNGCEQTKQTLRASVYESLFRICFFLVFANQDELDEFVTDQRKVLENQIEDVKDDVKRINALITQVEKKEANIFDAIENFGVSDRSLIERLKTLKDEKAQLIENRDEKEVLMRMDEDEFYRIREEYSDVSLYAFINAEKSSKRRQFYIKMIEHAYIYKETLIIKYRNSKVFIIPLVQNRGRLIQRQFDVQVGYKGREQYTVRIDTDNESFSLLDVKLYLRDSDYPKRDSLFTVKYLKIDDELNLLRNRIASVL